MKPLIFLLLFIPSLSFAQKQHNIWYFGDKAGIDFNTGSPVALTNGAMVSFEGTAAISDMAGNLLFYTNGGEFGILNYAGGVWNRNHQLMPNGNLDSIYGGCNSSSDGCLIVPDPASPNIYYIFTLDCAENTAIGGLRYCKVDMTMDGGLGDVTVKGIQLTDTVNESMCGLKHQNGTDYWVVVHKTYSNTFHAYQVTSAGILPPVITNIGATTNIITTGHMKGRGDDAKICYSTSNNTLLFDFDNSTGILSNYIDILPSIVCEFSANCRFLYVQTYQNPNYQLYQYDLNAANIPASYIEVTDSLFSGYRPMQLAPDGKIYIVEPNDTLLDVIHSPDILDTLCNYQPNDFYLGGKVSRYGVPNLITSLYGGCNFTEIGIEEQQEETSIAIYPNPTAGIFTVQGTGEIQVYDLFGRLVLRTNKREIDMGSYPKGIYMVRAGEVVRKVILQ